MLTKPNNLVSACAIRIPEELVAPSRPTHFKYGECAKRLARHMRLLHASAPRDQRSLGYISTALNTSIRVFICVDGIQLPLQPLYDHPFHVIKRGSKTFISDVVGRYDTASINRIILDCGLTDGFLLSHDYHHSGRVQQPLALPVEASSRNIDTVPPMTPKAPDIRSIRWGRKVKQPIHFTDFVTILTSDCWMSL